MRSGTATEVSMECTDLQFFGGNWSRPFPALDGPQTLVLVFGAPSFLEHPGPLHDLRAAYPQALMLGCSTSGEILSTRIFDESLAVAIVCFERTMARLACIEGTSSDDSRVMGLALGHELSEPDLQAVLVLSDGLHINGSELAAGLSAGFPQGVSVSGGLAGDGTRFQKSWVLAAKPGKPLQMGSCGVAAVGFYGTSLRTGQGSKGGWASFGIERTVTRSKGNVLYELDHRPALDLYKNYLGELASGLPAMALRFPLSLNTGDPSGSEVVRTILGVDDAERSLTFAGDIPEGSKVALMRCDPERLITGAGQAAQSIADPALGPALSVAISCVGRRLVLGERTEEELEAVMAELPEGSRQLGFYSYGEISPASEVGCQLHNQTMTLTTFQER